MLHSTEASKTNRKDTWNTAGCACDEPNNQPPMGDGLQCERFIAGFYYVTVREAITEMTINNFDFRV
jgi:hypothetical protein